jgi:hypothetical protein
VDGNGSGLFPVTDCGIRGTESSIIRDTVLIVNEIVYEHFRNIVLNSFCPLNDTNIVIA